MISDDTENLFRHLFLIPLVKRIGP